MSIQIYKPNKSNSGCGFSFSVGVDRNSQEPVLFLSGILQHSWDPKNNRGTFIGSKDDPNKNITVKFNEFECGSIISCLRNRHEWNTFHQSNDTKTTIKLSPWDKEDSVKYYDPSSKDFKTKKQIIPAFGLSVSRSKGNTFKMPLEPGEVECIIVLLENLLSKIYMNRLDKLNKSQNSYTEPFDD